MVYEQRVAAIRYAELGFRVFPVKYIEETNDKGETVCRKQPLTTHGHLSASSNPPTVERMFQNMPADMIGMVHDRFLVLDVDTKKGQPGAQTYENIKHLLPHPIATATTASGGFHLYYPLPETLPHKRDTRSLPGIDILMGPGGWVVVPPSEGYYWTHGDMETIADALY